MSFPPSAAKATVSAESPAPSRAARRAITSRCRVVRPEDPLGGLLLDQLGEDGRPHLPPVRRETRVLDQEHALGAPFAELLDAGLGRIVRQPHRLDLTAK